MKPAKVYVDFHNADTRSRLRLNCIGTIEDLARQQILLSKGLVLTLTSDDGDEQGRPVELQVGGVVDYSTWEHCWVAAIEWTAICRVLAEPEEAAQEVG